MTDSEHKNKRKEYNKKYYDKLRSKIKEENLEEPLEEKKNANFRDYNKHNDEQHIDVNDTTSNTDGSINSNPVDDSLFFEASKWWYDSIKHAGTTIGDTGRDFYSAIIFVTDAIKELRMYYRIYFLLLLIREIVTLYKTII